MSVPQAKRAPLDVSDRASTMPRNSCLLYPNPNPRGDDPASYVGVMRTAAGELYWLGAWAREVRGRKVIEIRQTPKLQKKTT